jgi:hypothetical protein
LKKSAISPARALMASESGLASKSLRSQPPQLSSEATRIALQSFVDNGVNANWDERGSTTTRGGPEPP